MHGESSISPFATIDSLDGRAFLRNLPGWPSLEESQEILDLVVLNVGISQQLFDARLFADNLYDLYREGGLHNVRKPPPLLWIIQALLVMAIGRLLQARPGPGEEVPGTLFFREATNLQSSSTTLKSHGILGVEVAALTALYLQVADRKEEAYVQVIHRHAGYSEPLLTNVPGQPRFASSYCPEHAQGRFRSEPLSFRSCTPQ